MTGPECGDTRVTPEQVNAAVDKLNTLLRGAGILPARDVVREALEEQRATMNLDPVENAIMRRALGLERST